MLFSSAQAAEVLTTLEASGLLKRMAVAARVLNYNATYLYQHADNMETFRVVHVYDANGEQERRESLDGMPREFIRNNDQIIGYLPDEKPFTLDRRTANKFFPGVILDQAVDVLSNYTFRRLGMDRVAGYDCQLIVLEPNDKLRNPHKLCVDVRSGLLLKSVMYSPDDRGVMEQFAFSQLEIGGQIDKRLLKPVLMAKSNNAATLTSKIASLLGLPSAAANASPPPGPTAPAPVAAIPAPLAAMVAGPSTASGAMAVGDLPAGFHLLNETLSQMQGKPKAVRHLLFSDGLVNVSVFVEPSGNGPISLPRQQGALNFFSRQIDGWRITAVGEVPLKTVQLFTMAFEIR
ncbi:MucB/RseB C-terminal domain-containing protein [Chitinimonas sp.]|uniref:MucB/RseB C-terminal domain-containing protein n=1 Tax=Chitinimonas sp. TaxID=1934313 RepID=UPI0035B480CF